MPKPPRTLHRRSRRPAWPWLLALIPVGLAAAAWQRSRDDEAGLTAQTRARLTPAEA